MSPYDPNSYGHTWYGGSMVAVPERWSLTYDLDVDVCVIGGGLAGLTTAREVARRGWSVAVLEANRIAWSASGRNGGFVLPGYAERVERIIERVGLERAKRLWALSVEGVEYVRATIRETGMPGVDLTPGWLMVQRVDEPDEAADLAGRIGLDFGTPVELWSPDEVRQVLRTSRYFQGVHLPTAFHIHPLNYALGVAADAERLGARIFEGTPALSIDPSGLRKRVLTPQGRVRADHVVLAGSAHLGSLFPVVSSAVLPVTTYLAATEPLGEHLRDAIAYHGAVTDTRRAGDYYRVVAGTRLLWGGRITTRLSEPRALARGMQRRIRSVFPQLGAVKVEQAWSGTMGYALHRMPLIGEFAPGIWVATAFGGHGLNTTAMAGCLIAGGIIERDDRWREFAPYELVWAGGALGRSAVQMTYWSMHTRDVFKERVARRRDVRKRLARDRAERHAQARAVVRQELEIARREAEEATRRSAEERARQAAEQEAQRAREEAAWAEAERIAREVAHVVAQRHAEERAQSEAEERARLEAEALARQQAEERARREAIERAAAQQAEAERRAAAEAAEFEAREVARLAAIEAERVKAEERTRQLAQEAEWRAIEDAARDAAREAARKQAEEEARLLAEERARRKAQEQARREAEERARQEAYARARQQAIAQARIEEQAQQRIAQQQARLEAAETARRQREEVAWQEAEAMAHQAADVVRVRYQEERSRAELDEALRRQADELARRADEERLRREAQERAAFERDQMARRQSEEAEREAAREAARLAAVEAAQREAGQRARQIEQEAQRRAAEEAVERAAREAERAARRAAKEEARRQAREAARLRAEERDRRRAELSAQREAQRGSRAEQGAGERPASSGDGVTQIVPPSDLRAEPTETMLGPSERSDLVGLLEAGAPNRPVAAGSDAEQTAPTIAAARHSGETDPTAETRSVPSSDSATPDPQPKQANRLKFKPSQRPRR